MNGSSVTLALISAGVGLTVMLVPLLLVGWPGKWREDASYWREEVPKLRAEISALNAQLQQSDAARVQLQQRVAQLEAEMMELNQTLHLTTRYLEAERKENEEFKVTHESDLAAVRQLLADRNEAQAQLSQAAAFIAHVKQGWPECFAMFTGTLPASLLG